MTRDTALVLTNLTLATMVSGNVSYGLVEDGAIVLEGGQILYAGPKGLLPDDFKGWEHEDCGGAVATPALIDCHTHLVYGGNRAKEFELRPVPPAKRPYSKPPCRVFIPSLMKVPARLRSNPAMVWTWKPS